jgi:hypothetical protein
MSHGINLERKEHSDVELHEVQRVVLTEGFPVHLPAAERQDPAQAGSDGGTGLDV